MNASEPVLHGASGLRRPWVYPGRGPQLPPVCWASEARCRAAGERESQLTDEETAELNGSVDFEHILGLAKAKAQLILATRT